MARGLNLMIRGNEIIYSIQFKKKKEGDGLKGSPHNSRDSTDIPVLERNLLAFPC